MSITEQLAHHIASSDFAAMPTEAVEAAKVVILDGLAVNPGRVPGGCSANRG